MLFIKKVNLAVFLEINSLNLTTFYELLFSFFFLASLRDWIQISFIISVKCSVAKFTPSLSVVKVVVSN